jgi:hypothetical protein
VESHRDLSRRMLTLEAAGFLSILAIIWMDEIFDLPHLLFGAPATPVRMVEGLLESFLTIVVASVIVGITYRAFRRIAYLESLIVMCAWCRRVRSSGDWVIVEEFLERQHRSRTTHGICESCADRVSLPFPSSAVST